MADDPASFFAAMAERIARIDAAEFAGAAVIVPKDGDPIVFLLADPSPKAGQFWTGLASRVEIAAAEAQQAETQDQLSPFGRRRA